jgi:hypothetical protein
MFFRVEQDAQSDKNQSQLNIEVDHSNQGTHTPSELVQSEKRESLKISNQVDENPSQTNNNINSNKTLKRDVSMTKLEVEEEPKRKVPLLDISSPNMDLPKQIAKVLGHKKNQSTVHSRNQSNISFIPT